MEKGKLFSFDGRIRFLDLLSLPSRVEGMDVGGCMNLPAKMQRFPLSEKISALAPCDKSCREPLNLNNTSFEPLFSCRVLKE